MCYSKEQGGLRCTSSIKRKIISQKKRLRTLEENNGSEHKKSNCVEAIKIAMLDYDTTDEGLKALQKNILEETDKQKLETLKKRYEHGLKIREQGLAQYAEWKKTNKETEIECDSKYLTKSIELRDPKKEAYIDHDNPEVIAATLLLTPSGSRLYNLHHEESDYDYLRVVEDDEFSKITGIATSKDKHNIIQKVIGDKDNLVISFDTFTNLCNQGHIQSLEALFSQQVSIDKLKAYRDQWVVSIWDGQALNTYRRTINNMMFSKKFKERRHAARLAMNLEQLFSTNGMFNPTLDKHQVEKANKIATLPPREYTKELQKLTRIEIDTEYDYEELEEKYEELKLDPLFIKHLKS